MDMSQQFREFLMTRRAKVTPERAGLPSGGGKRRVAQERRRARGRHRGPPRPARAGEPGREQAGNRRRSTRLVVTALHAMGAGTAAAAETGTTGGAPGRYERIVTGGDPPRSGPRERSPSTSPRLRRVWGSRPMVVPRGTPTPGPAYLTLCPRVVAPTRRPVWPAVTPGRSPVWSLDHRHRYPRTHPIEGEEPWTTHIWDVPACW